MCHLFPSETLTDSGVHHFSAVEVDVLVLLPLMTAVGTGRVVISLTSFPPKNFLLLTFRRAILLSFTFFVLLLAL